MKDKNKFTLKIVLVIALAVALIATLISCCVLATKGKLATQASCDNNQTAFANERPDLDCYATAASSADIGTDYISISQANDENTYYGILIPDNLKNRGASLDDNINAKNLFAVYTSDEINLNAFSRCFNGLRSIYFSMILDSKSYTFTYLLNSTRFSNEFRYDLGFCFSAISTTLCDNLDIYVRTTPYTSGGDTSGLQAQIDTLTAEKAALQTQVNNLSADKTALQTQVTEKQNQIDRLIIQKNALQKQVNDLTAKNTDLQNRLDKLLSDNYFCKFETVVGDYYVSESYYSWGYAENNKGGETPFGGGQIGKKQNALYIDRQSIVPHFPLEDKDKILSFHNTFYLYKNENELDIPVNLTGLIDFVEYSIKNKTSAGYPILMTNTYGTPRCIAFRLVDYNVDAMKDVVISDRTYKTGYDKGRANGISEATQNGHIFESSTSFLKSIFTDLGQLLDIKVFGNITVGTLIGIPLILLVVMAVLKLVRG